MNWWLTIPSWVIALYFGCVFCLKAGFPPKTDLLVSDAFFVGLFLFFLFLPFFNKIKIGSWIELEREVKEAKKEVVAAKDELREFKAEVRNMFSVVSTNVAMQKMSNQFNFYRDAPDADELRAAQATVEAKANLSKTDRSVEDYKDQVRAQENSDTPLMLAKVRMDIERLLRQIVGARTITDKPGHDPIKFATTSQLFQRLVASNDNYIYLKEPFSYVNRVCNAAIHAQTLSNEQANEALRLGAQIVEALSKHPDAPKPDTEPSPA